MTLSWGPSDILAVVATSDLLLDIFGAEMPSSRVLLGAAGLPPGMPIEIEIAVEINA